MNRNRMSFKDALDHADALDLPDGAALAMAEEFSGVDACDGIDSIDDLPGGLSWLTSGAPPPPTEKVKPIPCKFCPRRFDSDESLQKHITAKRRNKCIRHGLAKR